MAFSSSSSPFESYTKEKKKKKAEHVGNGKKLLWYLIIKRIVSLVGSSKLLKRKKRDFYVWCLKWKDFYCFFMFFLCTIQRREISLIFPRASPLVLNFCTIRMVSWSFIIGWAPPLHERIKRFDFDSGRHWPPPSPFPLSSHTHTLHRYIHRWYKN